MRVFFLVLLLLSLHPELARAEDSNENAGGVVIESCTSEIRLGSGGGEASVLVTGRVPQGAEVVIRLTGSPHEAAYAVKDKAGPFWLASGRVRFGEVPDIYLLRSSDPIAEILSPDERKRWILGESALFDSIRIEGDLSRELYIGELIRIKEKAGLYSFRDSGVIKGAGGRFDAAIPLSEGTPAGVYLLEVFAVRGGAVISHAHWEVRLEADGLSAWLGKLARNHGLLYGCLAVLLAMLTGILAGLLFKGHRMGKPAKAGGSGQGPH